MDPVRLKFTVVPDHTEKGSEGRLCLQLPSLGLPDDHWPGRRLRVIGNLTTDGAIMLIEAPDGKLVSPRSQLWWKNGVRDHGIRRNHWGKLYVLDLQLLVVQLVGPTDEPAPVLPPSQPRLFT